MGAKQVIDYTVTSAVIGAFPDLFTPRAYKDEKGVESKDKNFGLAVLFSKSGHPDLGPLSTKMQSAAQLEWPEDWNTLPITWSLRDGDVLADERRQDNEQRQRQGRPVRSDKEMFRGYWVLYTSTGEAYPPVLGFVANGVHRDVPVEGPERVGMQKHFFGGMECFVKVNFKAYKVGNNPRTVKAYLQGVESFGGTHNPKLEGGRPSAGSMFGASVTGKVSSMTGDAPAVAGLPG